jgi:glycosyltransferase involved in cell wall biosynthesis
MKLSILIPSLNSRHEKFSRLIKELDEQAKGLPVEINYRLDNGEASIGEKRNKLLQSSGGKYVCFVDDDDRVRKNYIDLLLEGIDNGVDCCSLVGEITFDGKYPKRFEHSIKHDKYDEVNGVYIRFPNHLNCIKGDIARQFDFPLTNFGEDTSWAHKIHNAKVLKTEHWIEETIYYYDYITNK